MDESEREKLRVPFWCPICEIPMKSGSGGDDHHYFKFGCCRYCFVEFIEHREERWQGGWRPSKDEVDSFFQKLKAF